jgi:hypothetical protein
MNTIYIYTHERVNDLNRTNRVKFIQAELTSFV